MDATDKMAFISFAILGIAGVIIAVRSYQLGENVPTKQELLEAVERGAATVVVPTSTDN